MLSIIFSIGSSRFDKLLGTLCGGWLCWVIDLAPCNALSRNGRYGLHVLY